MEWNRRGIEGEGNGGKGEWREGEWKGGILHAKYRGGGKATLQYADHNAHKLTDGNVTNTY
jgi:hypothetical protein